MENKTMLPVSVLVPVFLLLLVGLPTAVAGYPVVFAPTLGLKWVALCVAPVFFSLIYVGLSALLSFPFQKAIIRGKFPRQLTHAIYGPRRLYGLCWGAIFYFTPLYYAFMSVPLLRKFLLWSYGYRGHSDINIAPDAWIRDLPLLKFKQGVYAANKCTIGTNICLANGHILVDAVTLGERAMIGHLAMVAPGCVLGDGAEVGVGSAIGIRVCIGSGTRVAPTTSINHGAQIGSKVDIGAMSYIGVKARIADGITLPSGSNIPEGAEIKTQEDVARYLSSETRMLSEKQAILGEIYRARTAGLAVVGSNAVTGSRKAD